MPLIFKPFKIGKVTLKAGKPLIAGVLNVTPDSFSDGNRSYKKADAIKAALLMEQQGADIIDIGGESSRPDAKPVPTKEELRRVIPVIEGIRKCSAIAITIDSCKAEVARAAIAAGADGLNDITGFASAHMAELAAECGKPIIIMHMQGNPRSMQKSPRYENVTTAVATYLKKQAKHLQSLGVKKIIIDPGIGFGKTLRHNLSLLHNIKKLSNLGYPLMIGASRKSFIGKIDSSTAENRLGGTIAANILAISNGAAIIRVHDVRQHRQAVAVAARINAGR